MTAIRHAWPVMRYLLDTNACIEVLRGRNPALKARLAQNPERDSARLKDAFGHWARLSFDDAAAERYGEIRAHLQRAGNLIGGNDLLIAAIAQAQGLTLITHNTAEFTRVPGLSVKDWQV